MKKEILAELEPLTVLCDCLKVLDISLGFLASSPRFDSKMYIKEYLEKHLSFPEDKLEMLKSKVGLTSSYRHIHFRYFLQIIRLKLMYYV